MDLARAALVDTNGVIQNIVMVWADDTGQIQDGWVAPDGLTAIVDTSNAAYIGGTYTNGMFTGPTA